MTKRRRDKKGPEDIGLMRVDIEDGVEIPMIHAWTTVDPTEMARARQLEEMAEEIGITPPGTWDRARRRGEERAEKQRKKPSPGAGIGLLPM